MAILGGLLWNSSYYPKLYGPLIPGILEEAGHSEIWNLPLCGPLLLKILVVLVSF